MIIGTVTADRSAWPYPHLLSVPDSIPVHGSDLGIQRTVVPGPGFTVNALSYQVPNGFRFFLWGILADLEGPGIGPGDILWSVVSNPNNSLQSNPVQGLVNIPVSLGSWANGRIWELPSTIDFTGLDTIVIQANNILVASFEPIYYVAGVFGWLASG